MTQFFRAGVGAVICNDKGMVLTFERSDTAGAWQFPQGGIDDHEEPETSVYREITEETGIRHDALRLIRPCPHLLSYELPAQWRTPKVGRGQTQQWYLFLLLTGSEAIALPSPGEFRQWRWTTFPDLLTITAPFRLPVYRFLAQEFSEIKALRVQGHNP